MKILVAIKRVVDPNVRVRAAPDGSGINLGNLKMTLNPFDEIAVEQAVQLKEAGVADEVVCVTVGVSRAIDTLRNALAMGADRGVLVEMPGTAEPLIIAKILEKVIGEEQPDLVILGKQAIDDDCNQTGQMLAGLLSWPQATFVCDLGVESAELAVTREIDGGLQRLSLTLPAVVTADLRLKSPRYVTLPQIMAAKKKRVDVIDVQTYGVDTGPRTEVLAVFDPPGRTAAGTTVADAAQLLECLKDEIGALG